MAGWQRGNSDKGTEAPAWDGTSGITTSVAAAVANGGNPVLYGLAYALGSDLIPFGTSTVAGAAFWRNDVLVMFTIRGDVAFDGQNDTATSTAVIDFGGFGTTWEQGDFHYFGGLGHHGQHTGHRLRGSGHRPGHPRYCPRPRILGHAADQFEQSIRRSRAPFLQ